MLREHPQWKHLQALLERVAQSEYDRLAQGLPYEDYLAQVGAYQAARRTVDLVDTILDKVKADDDSAESREQHATDHRKLVTFGTPWWR